MKKKEKELFKALYSFQAKDFDESLLEYGTPWVLGQLFFNRLPGVAYDILKQRGSLGKVNREFRYSLQTAYEQNKKRNRDFYRCVGEVAEILEQCDCTVALLKGALLCGLYPEGYRTANDIDLLVAPQDITKVGKRLQEQGFRQGYIRNGQWIPADRREIIESRMTRGEVIPYIKEVNWPEMKYAEVDINFSLDCQSGDEATVQAMLERVTHAEVGGRKLPTLCKEDFFIHLCGHLYKEATTLPWIEMGRDMTLYKYMDLYWMLGRMSDWEIKEVFDRAEELEMQTMCAYGILQTAALFEDVPPAAIREAGKVQRGDELLLERVFSPAEGCRYRYGTADIEKRFFMEDRRKDLRREMGHESTGYAPQ